MRPRQCQQDLYPVRLQAALRLSSGPRMQTQRRRCRTSLMYSSLADRSCGGLRTPHMQRALTRIQRKRRGSSIRVRCCPGSCRTPYSAVVSKTTVSIRQQLLIWRPHHCAACSSQPSSWRSTPSQRLRATWRHSRGPRCRGQILRDLFQSRHPQRMPRARATGARRRPPPRGRRRRPRSAGCWPACPSPACCAPAAGAAARTATRSTRRSWVPGRPVTTAARCRPASARRLERLAGMITSSHDTYRDACVSFHP